MRLIAAERMDRCVTAGEQRLERFGKKSEFSGFCARKTTLSSKSRERSVGSSWGTARSTRAELAVQMGRLVWYLDGQKAEIGPRVWGSDLARSHYFCQISRTTSPIEAICGSFNARECRGEDGQVSDRRRATAEALLQEK